MSTKLKLTKIELKTKGGKKVELSIDEARELHSQLDELFGDHYVPTQPIIIERDRYPWPPYPYIRWSVSPTIASVTEPQTSWVTYQSHTDNMQISYTGNEVIA